MRSLYRNLISFWIFGLCNNYAYVVMLSAADDLLKELNHLSEGTVPEDVTFSNATNRTCNKVSTGVILLANSLPGLATKLVAPYVNLGTTLSVTTTVLMSVASFTIVGLSKAPWQTFTGVAFASMASSFGEVTFLRYSANFNKNVVSTWSSGTGGAGVFGSLSYALFRQVGLSSRVSILIMLVIPAIMQLTYVFLLVKPQAVSQVSADIGIDTTYDAKRDEPRHLTEDVLTEVPKLSFRQKVKLLPEVLPYMVPLTVVYYCEYLINQGILDVLYSKDVNLTQGGQYRWYQTLYQCGVFISRSSINFFSISRLWLPALLQAINMVIFILDGYYLFIPYFWLTAILVLYEGLLGGFAYVNTYYKIADRAPREKKDAINGMTAISDSIGITSAAFSSIPLHNSICQFVTQ